MNKFLHVGSVVATTYIYIYLSVCSCFSLSTVRTRVGLPSPDGPDALLSRKLLCDPDSLPESVCVEDKKKIFINTNQNQIQAN